MSDAVLITLIIVLGLIVLFLIPLIGGRQIGRNKAKRVARDEPTHWDILQARKQQEPYDQDAEPEYGVRINNKNEGK